MISFTEIAVERSLRFWVILINLGHHHVWFLFCDVLRMIINHCLFSPILGDPGAVSRVDKMFVVKVYCKIETSPWALTLTEPVPEAFELPASDWPEKIFSGQSAKRSCRVTLVSSYTT